MRYLEKIIKPKALLLIASLMILSSLSFAALSQVSHAAPDQRPGVGGGQCVGSNCNQQGGQGNQQGGQGQEPGCGKGDSRITTKFNFGCNGAADNPIIDLAFALVRFLAAGVGVAVVISIILAGIQYSTSEGSPEATMKAKRRVQASLIALVIYIFTFAIVNYLVPGGFLNR
jgi:hypothetical protein